MNAEEHDDRTFFQRYRLAVGVVGLAVICVVGAAYKLSKQAAAPRRAPELTLVSVKLPPPPPPAPTPPPPPPVEQKMIEQAPVNEQEEKPEPPKEQTPAAASTNIKANGPADGFGLSGSGGNGVIGGRGTGQSGGSRWGWYAGQVQTRIADALRRNHKTRSASISGVKMRIWTDSTGRVTRALLSGSTGDSAVDEAITREVLTGLQLQEAPPAGMPMPIILRLSARRAN